MQTLLHQFLPWINDKTAESPYLRDKNRLGDVIAAIQAMATYKFYKLSFASWADRLSADESQAEKWKSIFLDHPEFFRLDATRERASLVWRRQFPKRYDVDEARVLTNKEFEVLDNIQKQRISRIPLSSADIQALIGTAVNLHSRALDHKKESKFEKLFPVMVGAALAAMPAIYVSHVQSQAAVSQIVIERQFSAIKDFSSACTQRILHAKRNVFLLDVQEKMKGQLTPELTDYLLQQHNKLDHDLENSSVQLQAQMDFANALFSTQLSIPNVDISNITTLNTEEREVLFAKQRVSVPKLELQCKQMTAQLISKLEK